MAARLRIAVPAAVAQLAGGSGHGNMWRHVLAGLGERAEIETRERAQRMGRFTRGPQVWLADGHSPPPETGGAPLVVQVHEASWADPELAHFLHPEFARAMAAATEASVHAASAVITPSEAARAQVLAAYSDLDPAAVHAVHHGVDLELFRPYSPKRHISDYILFVGVLHPRKNFHAVRIAAAKLGRRLVVVGSPPADRPDSRDLVEEALAPAPRLALRRIESPSDSELAELYAGASAFCLPSHFEGFGLPALEALACGAPTVVSDRGALPEVVGNAAVVTGTSSAEVEAGLREAIGNAGHLRAAARVRAQELPWSRTVDGWLAVLQSVAH